MYRSQAGWRFSETDKVGPTRGQWRGIQEAVPLEQSESQRLGWQISQAALSYRSLRAEKRARREA